MTVAELPPMTACLTPRRWAVRFLNRLGIARETYRKTFREASALAGALRRLGTEAVIIPQYLDADWLVFRDLA